MSCFNSTKQQFYYCWRSSLVVLNFLQIKKLANSKKLHLWLLLVWMLVGAILRFACLECKPPWTDEFSTLVFSLGNSFRGVPLDQVIATEDLLQPLQPDPSTTLADVFTHLMQESTHPPAYFWLAHLWMKLFPSDANGLVNLWGARALPALLGVLSIPATFGLSWLAFRSCLAGQFAAATIALSPYGIFLAQEARHYTLAILLVIASLSCLTTTVQRLEQRSSLSLWLCALWIIVNGLGIAVHYFFVLALMAEGISLVIYWGLRHHSGESLRVTRSSRWRLSGVVVGTAIACLAWFPEVSQNQGSKLTEWILLDRDSLLSWLNPIFQSLAAWITMVSLLPVEASQLPVIIASGLVMLIFFVWVTPKVVWGLKQQMAQPSGRLAVYLLGGFVVGAIALFFVITYVLGKDLTRGARYHFVYFPAVMVLLGGSLVAVWQSRRRVVYVVLLMGLLSGVTVVSNLGYRKYYQPDQFVRWVQSQSQFPVLIATAHRTHVQTGEMMGIGREWLHQQSSPSPQFLLAHWDQQPETAVDSLDRILGQQSRPFDLWVVNFESPVDPSAQKCGATAQPSGSIYGYKYSHYICR